MAGALSGLSYAQYCEAIYIAYFGRAADGGGLMYWENAYQTTSWTNIANLFAVQPEAQAEYGLLATPITALNPHDPVQIAAVDTFIDQVYQNLFNRQAESSGLAYWQNQILTGALSIGGAVLTIANAAAGNDATTLLNKVTAATYFTQETMAANVGMGTANASFMNAAHQSVVPVTSDPATVTASEAVTVAYVTQPFAITDNATSGHMAEGSVINYTVTAPAGTADGTVEHYTLTGTGSALSQVSGPISGTVTIEHNQAIIAVDTQANVLGGSNPTLTLTLTDQNGTTLATDAITLTEAQQAIASATSVNEGSSTNFTVSTSGAAGSQVAGSVESYTLSGSPNLAQIPVTDRSGTVTLDQSGQAVVTVHTQATVFNDAAAGPTFTMNLMNAGGTVSSQTVTLNETAMLSSADNAGGTTTHSTVGNQVVYSTTGGQVTDGQAVTFTVSVGNTVAGSAVAGTQENWSLSGSALSDVVGPTSGVVTLDANGNASVTVHTNFSTTAAGSLELSLNTNNVAGTPDVTDTVTMNAATQSLAATPSTVIEGSGLSVAVTTPSGAAGGAAAGTVETYTITGSAQALQQLSPSELSGSVTLDQNGNATIPLTTLANVFNSTLSPTFTVTLDNGATTLPTALVHIDEAAVLASSDSAGGVTSQGQFGNLITEYTTGGEITDNGTVTFTVSVSGVAGSAVAGTQEAWSLSDPDSSGVLSQVLGATSGTLTLDGNGQATVTIHTEYEASTSAGQPNPFSGGDLLFSLSGLPVTDDVYVNIPAILYFTTAPNEVLVGGYQDTTFVGVVDASALGSYTMENGEAAQGQAGYANVLDVTVNFAVHDIVPGSAINPDYNIQTLVVTDLNPVALSEISSVQQPMAFPAQESDNAGSFFNLQWMPQLQQITTQASDVSYDDFFNIQNLVNVTVANNDYSGEGALEFDVVNDVAGGPVSITLMAAGDLDLAYIHTNDNPGTNSPDFVTAFDFYNLPSGQGTVSDDGIHLDGAMLAQTITASGSGSLWLSFDSRWFGDDNSLLDLTLVDAAGVTGTDGSYGMSGQYDTTEYQFGFAYANIFQPDFTFYGAAGNTYVDVNLEVQKGESARGGTFDFTTYGGSSEVYVNSYRGNGETINVYNTGGGDTNNTDTGSDRGGDSITLHGWEAENQTLTVTSLNPDGSYGNGNNDVSITSADNANVTVAQGDGDNNIDVELWNGQIPWLGVSAGVVSVTVGDGSNHITVDTAADGPRGDVGSQVNVTAGNGDHNHVDITEGWDAQTTVTVGNGDHTHIDINNQGGDYNGDDVFANTTVTVGTGDHDHIQYTDNGNGWDNVLINAGYDSDTGTWGGGAGHIGASIGPGWADSTDLVVVPSTLVENIGSGSYWIYDNLTGSYSTVNVTDEAPSTNGDHINITMSGEYDNDATVNLANNDGNNVIDVTQASNIDPYLWGWYWTNVDITAGNGNNDVTVTITSTGAAANTDIELGTGSNTVSVTEDAYSSDVTVHADPTGSGNNGIAVNLANSFDTTEITAGNGNNGIGVILGGSYDTATITAGNGDNLILVTDDSQSNDSATITLGNGSNYIGVDFDEATASTVVISAGSPTSTGNNFIDVALAGDSASSASITTGGGNDYIDVTGTTGGAAVTVSAGAGNDWVGVDSLTLPATISLDGGSGYNTLGLVGNVTALPDGATPVLVAADIQNFQAVEFTSSLVKTVDLLDLGPAPQNNINQVILDSGFGASVTVSGLTNYAEIDLLYGNGTHPGTYMLSVPIGNSVANPVDQVNILLDSQDDSTTNSFHNFDIVNVDPAGSGSVHTVNIESTAYVGQADYTGAGFPVNDLAVFDPGIQTLNILGLGIGAYDVENPTQAMANPTLGDGSATNDGDIALNLSGSSTLLTPFQPAAVNADTFYAAIIDTDHGVLAPALGSSDAITFNADNTTFDTLYFGDHNGDQVYLGNYENTVTMGNGNGDVLTMTHTTNVYGNYDGYNTVTIGQGSNDFVSVGVGGHDSVTINNGNGGASGSGDTVMIGNGNDNAVTIGLDAVDNGRDSTFLPALNHLGSPATNINHETVSLGDGDGDSVTIGATLLSHTMVHGSLAGQTYYYGGSGGDNSVTIGDGAGSVTNATVTINGSDNTGTSGASIDTVTFNGSGGGGNTVTMNFATGSTINFGAHTPGDTAVFNHVTDSSVGYNDTITGFNGASDTINLTNVVAGNAVTHGLQYANGALAVLTVLNTDALDVTHDAVIYDYQSGDLYDFHGAVNSGNINAANTFEVQLTGTHIGVHDLAHIIV